MSYKLLYKKIQLMRNLLFYLIQVIAFNFVLVGSSVKKYFFHFIIFNFKFTLFQREIFFIILKFYFLIFISIFEIVATLYIKASI